jgi:hypothetical protein
MLCLGESPDDPEKSVVRRVWPKYGAPGWTQEDNVIFFRLAEEDAPINRPLDALAETTEDEAAITTGQMRLWRLDVIAYGPNGYDNLVRIRRNLFGQAASRYLKKSGLFIVPDIPAPRRAPELFNSDWWERADMPVRFNERVIYDEERVPYFEGASFGIDGQEPGGNSGKNSANPDSQIPEQENPQRIIARSEHIGIKIFKS